MTLILLWISLVLNIGLGLAVIALLGDNKEKDETITSLLSACHKNRVREDA